MIFKKKVSRPRKIYNEYNERLAESVTSIKAGRYAARFLLPPAPPWEGMSKKEFEEYKPLLAAMRQRHQRYMQNIKGS